MHKRFLLLNLMVIVMAMLVLPKIPATVDPAQIEAELGKLKRLETSLSEGGIAGLLKTASGESIAAPKISSSYFAGRIAKQEPDLAPLENAKRAFGLKVATALDGMAAEALRQANSGQRMQMATTYLDLADWLKSEKGYGNYLLVTRCENLSAVPLGHLIADLSFPMEKILAQRNRILPADDLREFRRTVLNNEAPEPFIGTLTGTDSQQSEQMEIAWRKQSNRPRSWFKERNIPNSEWKRAELPDDLQLFLDVAPTGPKTLVKSWDMDRHGGIAINGLRDNNIRFIDFFAKYRELVGTFPTEPPNWWKPDDPKYSRTGAAFEHAWRPFEAEHGPLFDPASYVYEQVKAGTFMDYESYLAKRAAKEKP